MGGVLDTIAEKFGFGPTATPTPTPSPRDLTTDYVEYTAEEGELTPTEYMLKVMGKKRGEPGFQTSEQIINQYLKFKGNTSASAQELENMMIEAMLFNKTPTPSPTPTSTPDWLELSDVGGVNAPLNYVKTPPPRR